MMAVANVSAQVESPQQLITRYTLQIQTNPDNIAAYIYRGRAYNDKGDHQSAIADFNKALTISPNNREALRARGYAYYFQKKYDSSITDFSGMSFCPRKAPSQVITNSDFASCNRSAILCAEKPPNTTE